MTKKTSEINPERNEKHRQWERFRFLPMLIILFSITLIAAIISWNRAERALDVAKEANAIAETWQTMYSETERECRLAQMEIDDFRIVLIKSGLIDDDHIGEKP